MGKGRLEAFSDGVLAIIITIMVLELRVPHGDSLQALRPLLPVLLSYVLSFTYVGIYWNNHHHMLHAAKRVSGSVLWANLHLLFWLSLLPFATGWMGENHFATVPSAVYGAVLLAAAIAYWLLQTAIIATDDAERGGHGDDVQRHLDVLGRRRRIARGVVVDDATDITQHIENNTINVIGVAGWGRLLGAVLRAPA